MTSENDGQIMPGNDITLHCKARQTAFLEKFTELLSVTKAAEACGISRKTVYGWLGKYDGFREQYEMAFNMGSDGLEDEAIRRVLKGVAKPVFHKGEQVGETRRYSDSLMIMLLKARMLKKYQAIDQTIYPVEKQHHRPLTAAEQKHISDALEGEKYFNTGGL